MMANRGLARCTFRTRPLSTDTSRRDPPCAGIPCPQLVTWHRPPSRTGRSSRNEASVAVDASMLALIQDRIDVMLGGHEQLRAHQRCRTFVRRGHRAVHHRRLGAHRRPARRRLRCAGPAQLPVLPDALRPRLRLPLPRRADASCSAKPAAQSPEPDPGQTHGASRRTCGPRSTASSPTSPRWTRSTPSPPS